MTRRIGGIKRSSWLTFRRRLLLVRLLLRGPSSSDELITAVQAELGDEGYPPAAVSALKHDLDALKEEYGCTISFQRRIGRYVLDDMGELALLDLPDTCLEALAFLEASFPAGAALPEHAHIREVLDKVIKLLPAKRREQRFRRTALRLQSVASVPDRIDPTVLTRLRRAVDHRQEVVFDYLSTFDDTEPRHHRVAPYTIFFHAEGHGYLDATLLEVTPVGNAIMYTAINYRLDRIVPGSVAILPNTLPPERVMPPTYDLHYRLLPVVARRRDVASYFPDTMFIYHDDGSATVKAKVTNLWQARQILLRYGTACQVIAPPELVELFRATAQGMAQLYFTGETRADSANLE